jgi:hypothetical protein
MTQAFPFLIQGSNVVVVIDNKPHTISKTHITFQRVVDAIKAQDWDLVRDIIEPKKVVLNYGQGNVSIQGDTFFWKGAEMHNALTSRMVQMLGEGFPIEPLVLFMENLMANPSRRAVQELYGFLEKNDLPITPDGHFLAYKKIRDDYKDIHSGTMDNSVGQIVQMERNEVDDDKDRTCSAGLHFCSKDYLPHFGTGPGSRVVILKINPADVVSIPSDYNDSKGRACKYEVIAEMEVDADRAFTAPVQVTVNTYDTTADDIHYAVEDAVAVAQAARQGTPAPRQDYDKFGRPLSMTKDAIRKREARARAAGRAVGSSWPMPRA